MIIKCPKCGADFPTPAHLLSHGGEPPLAEPSLLGAKCIVYGCSNRQGQGVFVGDICGPCRRHLISGEVGPTTSFLGEMRARLEDCAAYLAFHGPVGATPDSAALLLKDVRKVLHYPSPNSN